MMRYLAGAVVLILPLVTTAGEESEWYLGAGVGVARMNPNTSGTAYSVKDRYDLGGKLYGGYAVNSRVRLEGYYADLGSVEISPAGEIGYRDVGLSAVYNVYRYGEGSEALTLFLRGGVGRMLNKSSLPTRRDNDWHIMYGAGGEYRLNSSWSLRADLDLYDRDAQLLTVTLAKHFVTNNVTAPASLPLVVEPPPEVLPTDNANPDLDGDGIANESDQCPDTPVGTKVDINGCELEEVILLKGVEFASNSDALIGESQAILDEVAKTLRRYPEQKVEIAGYTDSQGAASYNEQLSSRRAAAVRDYLIVQRVSAEQLGARGYGEESPIADNDTVEGRAKNRRVELHLIK